MEPNATLSPDFLSIFYPGNVSIIFVLFSRSLSKPKHSAYSHRNDPITNKLQKAPRHSLSEQVGKIRIDTDAKCKIIGDSKGNNPIFNPLSEDVREGIGVRLFRFREYNENPPHENIGKEMDGLLSKVKEIEQDRNCLFGVISYMLGGHEENYDEIR